MTITVLDKATGLPVDPQVSPVDGDWVQETLADGTVKEYEYHDAVAPVVDPIRIITVRAFMKRFTQAERIAMRTSTDDIVIDLMSDLNMAAYVDLDDPDIMPGLMYISGQTDPAISVNIIDPSRVTTLTADGVEPEAYNGIL